MADLTTIEGLVVGAEFDYGGDGLIVLRIAVPDTTLVSKAKVIITGIPATRTPHA